MKKTLPKGWRILLGHFLLLCLQTLVLPDSVSSSFGWCSTYLLHFPLSLCFPWLKYTSIDLSFRSLIILFSHFTYLKELIRHQRVHSSELFFKVKDTVRKWECSKHWLSGGYPQHESPFGPNLCRLSCNESVTGTFKICVRNLGFEKAH